MCQSFPRLLEISHVVIELCCNPHRVFAIYHIPPSFDLANLVQDDLDFHIFFFFHIPSTHWFHSYTSQLDGTKDLFLGRILLSNPRSTVYFPASSLGSHILHNLLCHLHPVALHTNFEEQLLLLSFNLLLLLLSKWLQQYFEHLLCLEPVIPFILSLVNCSAFVVHNSLCFSTLLILAGIPARTTVLQRTLARQIDSSHKRIDPFEYTIQVHFESCLQLDIW